MTTLADILDLDEAARLTAITVMPRFREIDADSGRIVMHTALRASEPGDIAGSAIARFLPDTVVTIAGYQTDGSDWLAVFEYIPEHVPPRSNEIAARGALRALDLTGVGADLTTRELARVDLRSMYRSRGIYSINEWSVLDLILGLVINLFCGDLVDVVDAVSGPADAEAGNAAYRRQRMDTLLHEWAAYYHGPQPAAD